MCREVMGREMIMMRISAALDVSDYSMVGDIIIVTIYFDYLRSK